MKNATNRPEGWESSRINHNRKGGAFEIEQPKFGPKGESRPWGRPRKTADRQLRRRSGLGEPANQPSGSERVNGHGEHGVENEVLNKVEIGGRVWDQMGFFNHQ
jgi:hypothetical protein